MCKIVFAIAGGVVFAALIFIILYFTLKRNKTSNVAKPVIEPYTVIPELNITNFVVDRVE